MATALSISLLFLITQLNAQEGIGCAVKTCPIAGQVRMNVVIENGQYVSGCDCVNYIWPYVWPNAQPNLPQQPIQIQPQQPIPPPIPQQPIIYIPPQPTPPPIPPRPIHTAPPTRPIGRPITVTCDGLGASEKLCECPPNHIGACLILCQGTEDACKNVLIKCNPFYPCIIDCIAPNACSSSTTINGPTDSSLTVNCFGEKSCETNTVFNGRSGTDLTVICNGITSCKDAVFNFGTGYGKIECNGADDSCLHAQFNIVTGQRGFRCDGSYCPPDAPQPFEQASPTWAPTFRPTNQPTDKPPTSSPTYRPTRYPTLSPTPRPTPRPTRPTYAPTNPTYSPSTDPSASPTKAPTVSTTICDTTGACACPIGQSGCIIACTGAENACKDGLIECNNNGHPCVVDCIGMNSCSGATRIIGPIGASLTVNCRGMKSCEGGFNIDAADSTNTNILCRGNEACKGGSVAFYFGTGVNSVICAGQPDSCKGAQFILPYNGAVAFECAGANCPITPANFNSNNPIQPIQQQPWPVQPQQPWPAQPQPQPQPQQPIQIQPTPRPVAPPTQPIPQTGRCCDTSTPGDKAWRGACWKATTEIECRKANTRKCDWNPTACLPNPPVNSFGTVCKFKGDGCVDRFDCCSENCMISKTCQ